MENPILQKKRMVQSRIEKSFMDGISIKDAQEAQEILKGIDTDNEFFEKARHGVYADNAENRRKNRVGQEYGHAAEQKEPAERPSSSGEQPSVEDHASNASDKALQRAAADKNASEEVRSAAKKELNKRGGGGNKKEDLEEFAALARQLGIGREYSKTYNERDRDFAGYTKYKLRKLKSQYHKLKQKYGLSDDDAIKMNKEWLKSYNENSKEIDKINALDHEDAKSQSPEDFKKEIDKRLSTEKDDFIKEILTSIKETGVDNSVFKNGHDVTEGWDKQHPVVVKMQWYRRKAMEENDNANELRGKYGRWDDRVREAEQKHNDLYNKYQKIYQGIQALEAYNNIKDKEKVRSQK